MKYQFCIRFTNIDANSAASKAVADCNEIFTGHGYQDYTFTVGDNHNKKRYYLLLLKEMISLLFSVKANSIIGIQYPLLSINNVFKYFIKLLTLKKVRFFCIVHDLESLRMGGKNEQAVALEISTLNHYDTVIVHNAFMMEWLKSKGVTTKMISLDMFDYLSTGTILTSENESEAIVYAGNLNKSTFIYSLPRVKNQHFNVYGPNFMDLKLGDAKNVKWCGEYSPEEIVHKLEGKFGLIWDGSEIDSCDELLGNYLRYNNPHKSSLYMAAGLPIIAPMDSAVGNFIKEHNIGLLINNLYDLETMAIDDRQYASMKKNVIDLRNNIIKGYYFGRAIELVEKEYEVR